VNRRGFTLIETLVAMSILLIGGASLWWALRRGFEADQRLRRNQIAQ
jgi:prepilin-type N-terminal cleavage/methylation domain-containing protein